MKKVLLFSSLLISGFVAMSQSNVELSFPEIKGYGGVVEVPNALSPKLGAKIIIDIKDGASADDKLNPGLDRVARLINLYKLSEISPDQLEIKIVLHGSATNLVLSDEAYFERSKVKNPNAELISQLVERKVEIIVCGQAYLRKGYKLDELSADVTLGLSALTTIIEFQQKGFIALYF
jgi:intracellular sulfur oxidation DsrE/DsrF family protein